jgi:hypothetical protein
MKKLGLATALLLTLAFGAGDVFAQNSNTSNGGGTMVASKHSRRRHHRRAHRRHRRAKAKAANANS